MTAILEFLQNIVDFLANLGDHVTDMVTGTGQALAMLDEFRLNLQGYLIWVPDSVYVVIYVGFALCCLYIIIGRC